MFEFLIYPVSGVMKLWHLLLHNVFGMDDALAWFLSLFGLVITVRAIIAPFSWQMYKAGRIGVKLRPHLSALEDEYAGKHDVDSVRELNERRRALQKEHGMNPAAGCVPMLIQIPVFIGLYQVLLRMARPSEGIESDQHAPIGFLSSDEVNSFLDGRVRDVPLPAYPSMTADQFALLDTSRDAVLSFVLPFLILAALFTALNMTLATYRNLQTTDFSSTFARRMMKFTVVLGIIAPLFPLLFGLAGPFPMAIALYWFANNLWTLGQMALMHVVLERKMPLEPEFKEFNSARKELYQQRQREKRHYTWGRRTNRLKMILRPGHAAEYRAENARISDEWEARLQREAEDKARRKELSRQRREAHRTMTQQKMDERRKAREAKKNPTPDEGGSVESAESAEDSGTNDRTE